MALTFDDGPSPRTVELARYLAEERVHATFFVCGLNVKRHPETIRLLAEAGHELGNHTWSHARLCPRLGWRLNLLASSTIVREVASAQVAIVVAGGPAPTLVRAPYGLRWWGLRRAQRLFGLLHIRWTVIAHDWEWDEERIVRHVLKAVRPGGIVCLHDGRDTRSDPDVAVTLGAVRRVVPELKRQGYRFETVSELLRTDAQAAAGREVRSSALASSSGSVAALQSD